MSMFGSREVTGGGTGNGLVLLFALPFLLVGVLMGTKLFSSVMEMWRARSWVEVPATLDRVELESQRGSKGGTTFRVVAGYHYVWEDRTIRGQRVSFHEGSNNVGSFHQQGQDAPHRLHRGARCGEEDPRAPRVARGRR